MIEFRDSVCIFRIAETKRPRFWGLMNYHYFNNSKTLIAKFKDNAFHYYALQNSRLKKKRNTPVSESKQYSKLFV